VHSEERHFALLEKVPYPTKARFQSVAGLETQSDPCISSVQRSIMIASSNSPAKGSRLPNRFLGVLLHTNACSGLARVRTEFFQLLVIPLHAPHPVQMNRESARFLFATSARLREISPQSLKAIP
jgi:hypothetical protein